MTFNSTFSLLICCAAALCSSAQSDPASCGAITNTGSNHTIIFASPVLTLNGNSLPNGSFIIAIFDDNGTEKCGGFIQWNGANTALAAFGDDATTPEKDGFSAGEIFKFRIELPNGATLGDDQITVEYQPMGGFFSNDSTYATNGISGIVSLHGSGIGDCVTNLTLTGSTLMSGIYSSSGILTSNNTTIDSGSIVEFTSDVGILLQNNFSVLAGGIFEAYIQACPGNAANTSVFSQKKY